MKDLNGMEHCKWRIVENIVCSSCEAKYSNNQKTLE